MARSRQTRRQYLRSLAAGTALAATGAVGTAGAQNHCDVTVDPGGGGDFTTIQAAIDDSGTADGDTVCVAAGTYQEQVTVDTELTLRGAGDGSVAASNSVLQGSGGNGFEVAADDVTIEKFHVTGYSNGIRFGEPVDDTTLRDMTVTDNSPRCIEVRNQADLSDLTLENVALTDSEDGFRVSTDGAIDGLTMDGCSVDGNDIGLEVYTADTDPSSGNLEDVEITDTSFDDNDRKGIYTETLSDATIDGVTVHDSGTSGSYGFNAGIDINLKYGDYSDITIRDTDVSGVDYGSPPGDRFPVGITIKARQDGSTYGGNPATLSDVTLEGVEVSDNPNGIRFGEVGKSDFGLQNGTVELSDVQDNDDFGLINETPVEIDARDVWWGHASGPGGPDGRRNPAGKEVGKGDDIVGDVASDPWLRRPTDHPSR
jgi:hypothetical protein